MNGLGDAREARLRTNTLTYAADLKVKNERAYGQALFKPVSFVSTPRASAGARA